MLSVVITTKSTLRQKEYCGSRNFCGIRDQNFHQLGMRDQNFGLKKWDQLCLLSNNKYTVEIAGCCVAFFLKRLARVRVSQVLPQ